MIEYTALEYTHTIFRRTIHPTPYSQYLPTPQIPRLLGISSTNIILLDLKTHAVVKTQKICDIDDWLSPSIKVHDSLMLEFRGTKPWTLMMSSMESLKSVTAAIWEALDMDGRFINNGALRRDSFEFGLFPSSYICLGPVLPLFLAFFFCFVGGMGVEC